MKLPPRNPLVRKESYSFQCGALKRPSRVYQNAVHIENNHRGMESHELARLNVKFACRKEFVQEEDPSDPPEDARLWSRPAESDSSASGSFSVSSESEDQASPASGDGKGTLWAS